MDKSITTEIEKILEDKLPQEEWSRYGYSNEDDFKKLWEIGGNEAEENNDKILVIWDGFPEDNSPNGYPRHNVDLSYYITPIDWALAYSRKHKDENKEIVILDMCSHEGHLYKGDKVKDFHKNEALLKMKSWVKFYSFNKMLYGNVCCSPLKIINKIEFNGKDNQQSITKLSEKWYEKLSDIAYGDETHHTINNILDPIQLAELTLSSNDFQNIYNKCPLHTKAFYQSLKWHGIVVAVNSDVGKIEGLDLGDALVVLVDDHAKHGWEDLLNYWIYSGGDEKIDSRTDPEFIIEKIKELDEEQYQQERFKLHFTESKDEIFVFDLYLYPSDKESDYFSKVIQCAKELQIRIDDLDDLHKNLENEKYRKEWRIKYLTLLPRLIAEIDPSIPIIVFSASEQNQDLSTEGCLGDYHSIDIFTKPAVFSYIDSNKIRDQEEAKGKRNNFRSRLYV